MLNYYGFPPPLRNGSSAFYICVLSVDVAAIDSRRYGFFCTTLLVRNNLESWTEHKDTTKTWKVSVQPKLSEVHASIICHWKYRVFLSWNSFHSLGNLRVRLATQRKSLRKFNLWLFALLSSLFDQGLTIFGTEYTECTIARKRCFAIRSLFPNERAALSFLKRPYYTCYRIE